VKDKSRPTSARMKTTNNPRSRAEIDHTVLDLHLVSANPPGTPSLRIPLRIEIDLASKIIVGIWPDESDFADDNKVR
jgi:hypothetical protein